MIYTHLKPGNIVRYNRQIWIIAEASKRTLNLVSFSSSKATLRILSATSNGAPVYLADNPAAYVISLISDTY